MSRRTSAAPSVPRAPARGGGVVAAAVVAAVAVALMATLFAVQRWGPFPPRSPSPAVAVLSGSAAPPSASPGWRDRHTVHVTFIGASVTRGWFASRTAAAFPERTADTLAGRGRDVRWTVEAEPGAPVDTAEQWSFPRRQDIVVVHVVTDDFLHGTPLPEYQARYRHLLGEVRAASPHAQLLCLGDWSRIGAVDRAGHSSYAYDAIVHDACAAYQGTYVPLNQLYDVPGVRGPPGRPTPFGISDAFHPNDAGHSLISQTVIDGLDGHPPVEQFPQMLVQAEPPALPRPSPGSTPETRRGRSGA